MDVLIMLNDIIFSYHKLTGSGFDHNCNDLIAFPDLCVLQKSSANGGRALARHLSISENHACF